MAGAVLVTGGAGYVGSHTVLELLKIDYEVVVVDNLVNSYKALSSELPECLRRVEKLAGRKVTFYNLDLSDRGALSKVFKKHSVFCVIHFAALKAVGESCQKPLLYYSNNITGSITLLEVMIENGVKNFVYSSSSTVYGNPQFLPLTEDHPTGQGCTNPYGKSKYFVEEILKDVCLADNGFRVISLRYFNPVGAHPSGDIGEDPAGQPNNLMPYIAQVAVGRRAELLVYGNDYNTRDGTGVRDYIHIMDLVSGHICAIEKLRDPTTKGFKTYNLGTGSGHSVLEVIEAFKTASGKDVKYKVVGRREGDIAESYCDASLASKELNWKAEKSLKEMCEDMWRWQAKNPNGFQGAS
ncbi:UDP-glucose 4-epimerase-like [Macrosteles quadrilineatus]|uniref:UDP-glucose 4-epimerase-like n=1 Tax=Macrosteles quadrilineatus TaxID=74068 RepID=UPI0023E2FE4A|nr:UDP-glucose 4-epimerase-like [Macrosteles quadrilineatus]